MSRTSTLAVASMIVLVVVSSLAARQQTGGTPDQAGGPFRFKSGVDLINVTTTVTDSTGRFVSGLRKEDFAVYDDGVRVELTQFSDERVPVSLGLVVDTSGSMAGTKMHEAQSALHRFLYDLLDKQDEIFVYRFSSTPRLLQGWTTDREILGRALDRLTPSGGTAMYDAVAEALPLAEQGQFRKKAIVVISDGNDTASQIPIRDLKQQIRESDALVYAVGIDGDSEDQPTFRRAPQPIPKPPRLPIPLPFPFPGGRGGRPFPDLRGPAERARLRGSQGGSWRINDDRVNVDALRQMTDDSGGRTEVIRDPHDLDPATANIADELSKQYYLGYQSSEARDGRWHAIRVEVKSGRYTIRARKGYVAS
jgi:VWFA-related protein